MAALVASSRRKRGLAHALKRPVGVTSQSHMALIPTAWGVCGIVWKNHDDESRAVFARCLAGQLCRICTPGLTENSLRQYLLDAHPGCQEVLPGAHGVFHPEVVPDWFNDLVRFLQAYYTTALRHQTEPEFADQWSFWRTRLDWSQVTPFQRQVLEMVARIPCSRLLTYGQIAARLGKPAAARAVGKAVGANPWPVLIPCHRVMGSAGKLTGFSAPGGIGAKRRMLALENGGLF
jgi:O-6-methylguanine DNA methyltransferase